MKKFAWKKCRKMFLEALFFRIREKFFQSFCTKFWSLPFTWDHWPTTFPMSFCKSKSRITMCNLHWCYTFCTGVTLFAPVLHFLHWCYTWTALLSANQNRVIFSCVLLGWKLMENIYWTVVESCSTKQTIYCSCHKTRGTGSFRKCKCSWWLNRRIYVNSKLTQNLHWMVIFSSVGSTVTSQLMGHLLQFILRIVAVAGEWLWIATTSHLRDFKRKSKSPCGIWITVLWELEIVNLPPRVAVKAILFITFTGVFLPTRVVLYQSLDWYERNIKVTRIVTFRMMANVLNKSMVRISLRSVHCPHFIVVLSWPFLCASFGPLVVLCLAFVVFNIPFRNSKSLGWRACCSLIPRIPRWVTLFHQTRWSSAHGFCKPIAPEEQIFSISASTGWPAFGLFPRPSFFKYFFFMERTVATSSNSVHEDFSMAKLSGAEWGWPLNKIPLKTILISL